jgi:hypothetical protein
MREFCTSGSVGARRGDAPGYPTGAATLDVDLDVGGQITPPRNISARSPMYMSC